MSSSTQSPVTEAAALSEVQEINADPLPAISNLKVRFNAMGNEKVSILFFDMQGRMVYTRNISSTKGINTIDRDVSSLKSGPYLLKIDSPKNKGSKLVAVGK
jgi:hypothetical protein